MLQKEKKKRDPSVSKKKGTSGRGKKNNGPTSLTEERREKGRTGEKKEGLDDYAKNDDYRGGQRAYNIQGGRSRDIEQEVKLCKEGEMRAETASKEKAGGPLRKNPGRGKTAGVNLPRGIEHEWMSSKETERGVLRGEQRGKRYRAPKANVKNREGMGKNWHEK